MKPVSEIKQQIISIKANDWNIPTDVINYELVLESMSNIGSTNIILFS